MYSHRLLLVLVVVLVNLRASTNRCFGRERPSTSDAGCVAETLAAAAAAVTFWILKVTRITLGFLSASKGILGVRATPGSVVNRWKRLLAEKSRKTKSVDLERGVFFLFHSEVFFLLLLSAQLIGLPRTVFVRQQCRSLTATVSLGRNCWWRRPLSYSLTLLLFLSALK